MITSLLDSEPVARAISMNLLVLGPKEQSRGLAQHRHNRQDLVDAFKLGSRDHGFREHRVRGKFRELPPELRELALVV